MDFLFDRKVVSMFLNVEETSEPVSQFFTRYFDRMNELYIKTLREFLLSRKVQIVDIDRYIEIEGQGKLENIENDNVLKDIADLVGSKEFQNLFQIKSDEYNKLVYMTFGNKLSADKVQELNRYVIMMQDKYNEELDENERIMDKVYDEIRTEIKNRENISQPFQATLTDKSSDQMLPPIDQNVQMPNPQPAPVPAMNDLPTIDSSAPVMPPQNIPSAQSEQVGMPVQSTVPVATSPVYVSDLPVGEPVASPNSPFIAQTEDLTPDFMR